MCIYWIYRFKTIRNGGNWILKKLFIQFSTVSIKLLTLSQKCTLAMFLQSDLVCLIIKSFLFFFSFSNKKGREDISILKTFQHAWDSFQIELFCILLNASVLLCQYCILIFIIHFIELNIFLMILSWNYQQFQRILVLFFHENNYLKLFMEFHNCKSRKKNISIFL